MCFAVTAASSVPRYRRIKNAVHKPNWFVWIPTINVGAGTNPGVRVSRIVNLRMAESFILVVNYKGKEYQLGSELRIFGYTHKIAINIDGEEILFEPDEERNYRAVMPGHEGSKTEIDIGLIQAITKELEVAFNH